MGRLQKIRGAVIGRSDHGTIIATRLMTITRTDSGRNRLESGRYTIENSYYS